MGTFKGEALHNKATVAIIPQSNVSVDYLFYCFREKAIRTRVINEIRTKTEITKEGIRRIMIPVPPEEEQKRIVQRIEALMHDVERGHALLRQMQEDTEQLLKRTITESFSEQARLMRVNIKKSQVRFDDIEQGILRDALHGKLFRRKENA